MKYVISSSEFDSKKKAIKQIKKWYDLDDLCPKAKVYSVKEEFKPVFKVELEKVK